MNSDKRIKKPPRQSLFNPTEQIKCPEFQSKNKTITEITRVINEAENVEKKAPLAERLIKEVEKLLSCKDFDKRRAECEICHSVAKLRKRTANLIIRAKGLKI